MCTHTHTHKHVGLLRKGPLSFPRRHSGASSCANFSITASYTRPVELQSCLMHFRESFLTSPTPETTCKFDGIRILATAKSRPGLSVNRIKVDSNKRDLWCFFLVIFRKFRFCAREHGQLQMFYGGRFCERQPKLHLSFLVRGSDVQSIARVTWSRWSWWPRSKYSGRMDRISKFLFGFVLYLKMN